MARFFELPHLLTLLVIVLLVFGASKLPDLARNLGKSAKILKADLQELREEKTLPEQKDSGKAASVSTNPDTSACPSVKTDNNSQPEAASIPDVSAQSAELAPTDSVTNVKA